MKEETKTATHTPGPWRISGNGREVYAKDPHGFTSDFVVADCSGREAFGPMMTGHSQWTAEANARLIATAPAMRQRLEYAYRLMLQGLHDDAMREIEHGLAGEYEQ